jgi:hypothetical protein
MGIAQNALLIIILFLDLFADIFFKNLEMISEEPTPPLVHSISYTIQESIYRNFDMFELEVKKLSLIGLTFFW